MKTFYIIFPGNREAGIESWHSVRTLTESLLLIGYRCRVLCLGDYTSDQFKDVVSPDAAVFIHVFTFAGYKQYKNIIQTISEWNTVFVNDVLPHYNASNKAIMYKMLEEASVSVPKTISIDRSMPTEKLYNHILNNLSLPFVIKPSFGFRGQFTRLCNSFDDLQNILQQTENCKFQYEVYSSLDTPMLAQEYLNDYEDLYLRIHACGSYMEGYIGVVSPYEEKKFNNFNKDRIRIPYRVEDSVRELVQKAMCIMNINVAACDILKTNDGYKIIDINSFGDYKTFDVVHNTNFASHVASFVRDKSRRKK